VQLKSFQDLTRFFVAEGVPFRCDEAAQMVELPTRSPPLVGTMAVLWRTGDHLVHFVHLLPFEIPVERLAVVEAAVARINHVLAFPGFGIDHEKRRAYFRVVMPRIAGDDSLDSRVIGPTISLYRLMSGENISAGQMAGDTTLGAGTGALGGVAQDVIESRLAPALGGPLSGVAGGGIVGGLTSGLFSTWNNAGAFNDGQESASQATANVLVDGGIGLGAGASGAALGAAIGSIVPGAGTAIGAGVGFLAGTLGSMAVNALADGSGFRQWADKEVGGLIEGLGAEDTLKQVWGGIGNVTSTIGAGAQALGSGISNVVQGAGTGISNFANGVGTGVSNIANGVGTGVSNLASGAMNVIGDIGGGISNTVSSIGSGLASFFGFGGGDG
jgi:hypothetical protein